MKKAYSLILFGMMLCSSLRVFAAHVTTDYDHSANFAQFKTYSWLKVQGGDSLWDNRIKHDVDAQLAAKGYTEVPSNGSVSVTAFRSTQNDPTEETFYNGLGGGWGYGRRGFGGMGMGMGMATTTTENIKVGTLVVDVFNTQSKQLLWHATESADLSGNPSKNAKALVKDTAQMFKHFPPQ